MASRQTQISAYVSRETKDLVDRYALAHGVKKGHLIESALLHHLQALQEIPADVVIPPVITVTRASGEALLARLDKGGQPTPAMRELMSPEGARGED